MIDRTIEEVKGIVIGQVETRNYYRFYSEKDNHLIWDAGHFENDQEAFKAFDDRFKCDPWLYKELMSNGVEMRAWR